MMIKFHGAMLHTIFKLKYRIYRKNHCGKYGKYIDMQLLITNFSSAKIGSNRRRYEIIP
jgi:hypothetical protein